MNVLVTNSVPLNGGDEALLRALLDTLAGAVPGTRFTVLTSATSLARRVLPDLRFDDDLEHAVPSAARGAIDALALSWQSRGGRLATALARRGVERLCGRQGRHRILELYSQADAVFAAPGGYLHDHYPVTDRLAALDIAVRLGKPVLLVGHSIGPFWKARSSRMARDVLDRVTRIVVREPYSLQHLQACGVRQGHVSMAADLAFAWAHLAPELFREHSGGLRRVGLCFRRWPLHDSASARAIRAKALALSRWLLRDPAVELVFVSTCQGVPGYVDDSRMAREIVAGLPTALRARCTVDDSHHSVPGLIEVLGSLDACISMRMHVCVLAMLGGTPAMARFHAWRLDGCFSETRNANR